MSSFKELNGPLGTEFHSFYKLGENDTPSHTCVNLSAQSSNRLTSQTQTQIGESFIAFDPTKRLLGPCGSRQEGDHSQSVQDQRATMPDQTRRIFSTTNINLSEPITIVTKSRNRQQQHNYQQSEFAINPLSEVNLQQQQQSQQQQQHNHPSEFGLAPLSETILQQQQLEQQHQSGVIVQQHSHSPRLPRRYSKPQGDTCDPQTESSVDSHLLQSFESSLQNSRDLGHRRSSPDLLALNSGDRSAALAISVDYPLGPSELVKMAGNQGKATNPQQAEGGVLAKPDSVNVSAAAPSPGLGLLSKTRQFGTWLGLAVDTTDKVEISKKDLNVFAPTTF